MSINEQKILLEMKIELQKGNTFLVRRKLRDLLGMTEKQNIDGFKLLFKALKEQHKPQANIEKPKQHLNNGAAYICPSCQVVFSTESALKGHGPKRCLNAKRNV